MIHSHDRERQQQFDERAKFVVGAFFRTHPESMLAKKVDAGALSVIEAYELLKELSRDPKTGVQRSDLLHVSLDFESSRAQRLQLPLTIGVFDIDHFKQINTELTHLGADHVLAKIAAIMIQQLRQSDDLLSGSSHEMDIIRWGGEEFVAVFTDTGIQAAKIAAERLRMVVADTLCGLRPAAALITVSGGLAELEPGSTDWSVVLRQADERLLVAKKAGRNKIEP